jgi:hypothetical protein
VSSPAEILLSHAKTQLADQARSLTTVRNRAATVLASAGVVAGFFAVSTAHPNLLLAAASLFGLGALLGVAVLLPVQEWEFAGDIREHLEWARDADSDQGDELALVIAQGLENERVKNARKLSLLTWIFATQCAVLAVQVIVQAVARGLSQ